MINDGIGYWVIIFSWYKKSRSPDRILAYYSVQAGWGFD